MPDCDVEVAGLLEAAARLWAATRTCWLATSGADGAVNLRPMGRTPPVRGGRGVATAFSDGRAHRQGRRHLAKRDRLDHGATRRRGRLSRAARRSHDRRRGPARLQALR